MWLVGVGGPVRRQGIIILVLLYYPYNRKQSYLVSLLQSWCAEPDNQIYQLAGYIEIWRGIKICREILWKCEYLNIRLDITDRTSHRIRQDRAVPQTVYLWVVCQLYVKH